MKTVLVTGDRNWEYYDAIERYLHHLSIGAAFTRLIHGAARGADSVADTAGKELGYEVIPVPAHWRHDKSCPEDCRKAVGPAAGPIRNRKMLDTNPDLVVAFHNNLGKSKGTKDCVTEARRRGIPVVLVTYTETLLP